MGHVRDRWTSVGAQGRRVHNERWGTKSKRWQARWVDHDGVEHAQAFGTRDEATVHLARVETGAPLITGDGITLATFAAAWLAGRLDLRPNSVTQIRSRLAVRILPALGARPLPSITRADVRAAVMASASAEALFKSATAGDYA